MKKYPKAVYDSNITEHSSRYYIKCFELFKTLRALSLFLLVAAILVSVVFFADGLTYNNVQMLTNVIDSEYNAALSGEGVGVSYNVSSNSVFGIYDENLVVVTDSDVSLYNLNGRELYSYSVSYENPRIVCSASVFLVYDLGGKGYSIYNKTGCIYSRDDCEYAVLSAAVSDSGRYCIVTKSRESSTSVLVYNKKSKLIGKYENNRYAASVAISDDGKYIAISTLTATDGNYNSVMSLYKIDKAELVYAATREGKLPISVGFFASDAVGICFSDEFVLYDKKGSVDASYSYSANQLSGIAHNNKNMLSFSFSYENSNNLSYLDVIKIDGKTVYNGLNLNKIKQMTFFDETLFLLHEKEIVRVIKDKQSTVTLADDESAEAIFALSDTRVLIVYPSYSIIEEFK